jgi:hypothetical protein
VFSFKLKKDSSSPSVETLSVQTAFSSRSLCGQKEIENEVSSSSSLSLQVKLLKYCIIFCSRWKFISVPKSQHTTVNYNQQLSKHTYTPNLYGLGTLTPIEFVQQDLFWSSSNTNWPSKNQSNPVDNRTRCCRNQLLLVYIVA